MHAREQTGQEGSVMQRLEAVLVFPITLIDRLWQASPGWASGSRRHTALGG